MPHRPDPPCLHAGLRHENLYAPPRRRENRHRHVLPHRRAHRNRHVPPHVRELRLPDGHHRARGLRTEHAIPPATASRVGHIRRCRRTRCDVRRSDRYAWRIGLAVPSHRCRPPAPVDRRPAYGRRQPGTTCGCSRFRSAPPSNARPGRDRSPIATSCRTRRPVVAARPGYGRTSERSGRSDERRWFATCRKAGRRRSRSVAACVAGRQQTGRSPALGGRRLPDRRRARAERSSPRGQHSRAGQCPPRGRRSRAEWSSLRAGVRRIAMPGPRLAGQCCPSGGRFAVLNTQPC